MTPEPAPVRWVDDDAGLTELVTSDDPVGDDTVSAA